MLEGRGDRFAPLLIGGWQVLNHLPSECELSYRRATWIPCYPRIQGQEQISLGLTL